MNFWRKSKNFNMRGFTLVEMLISIFIIITIASLVFYNFKVGRVGVLNETLNMLITDIREVQGHTLGLKKIDGSLPEGGWGIYFDTSDVDKKNTEYTIFGDGNGGEVYVNQQYDQGEEYNNPINLSNGLSINNIILTTTGGSDEVKTKVSIIYEPPDPTVYICFETGDCDYKEAKIELYSKPADASIYLFLNNFGLIDFLTE